MKKLFWVAVVLLAALFRWIRRDRVAELTVIKLSPEASLQMAEALLNPREPNAAMRAAAAEYLADVRSGRLIVED